MENYIAPKRNMELPMELIDSIMEFLTGDKKSLSSCSVVCHLWSESSRRVLFRTITYRVPYWKSEAFRMDNFCTFFHTAPGLAALVRELHISGNSITFPVFCLCHALLTLLIAFPNLQHLFVIDIHADCRCKMSWIRSQEDIRHGIRRVVVRVKYHTPIQVVGMFSAFSDLETLEVLSATKVINSNPVDLALDRQSIPRHLIARSYDATFPIDVLLWRLFRSCPDLGNLQSVQTTFYHGEGAEEFMNLLLRAHNIRSLDFRVSIAQSHSRGK